MFSGPLWLPEVEDDRLSIVMQESASKLVVDPASGTTETSVQPTQVQLVSSSSKTSEHGDGDVVSQSSKQEPNSCSEVKPVKSRPTDEVFRPSKVRPPRPRKKLVKYPVIGRNNVAVPTHLYKVSRLVPVYCMKKKHKKH
jgi:hypothetical protein